MKYDFEFTELPGGINSFGGGSRSKIKLDRSWQSNLIVDSTTCPFEDREELITRESFEETEKGSGWRIFSNIFTPSGFHKLIVPFHCWEKECLWTLGGEDDLKVVLDLALKESMKKDERLYLNVHVGPQAGQNLGHLHFHLLSPVVKSRSISHEIEIFTNNSKLKISEKLGFTIVCGGHRTGQCLISKTGLKSINTDIHSLAKVTVDLLDLYNTKFLSDQGNKPDFMLSFVIEGNNVEYGTYIPILNNIGATEFLGLLEGQPMWIAWPHSMTYKYLMS